MASPDTCESKAPRLRERALQIAESVVRHPGASALTSVLCAGVFALVDLGDELSVRLEEIRDKLHSIDCEIANQGGRG